MQKNALESIFGGFHRLVRCTTHGQILILSVYFEVPHVEVVLEIVFCLATLM